MCTYLLLICVFLTSWFTLLVCTEFTYPYLLSTCLIVKPIPPCQVALRKLRWISPRLVLMYVTGSIQRKLILPLDGQTTEQASNSAPGTLVDRWVLGWEGRGECQWTGPSLWLSVSLWWNVNFGYFSYWAQGLHYEKMTTSAVNTVLVVHRQRQFSLYEYLYHSTENAADQNTGKPLYIRRYYIQPLHHAARVNRIDYVGQCNSIFYSMV